MKFIVDMPGIAPTDDFKLFEFLKNFQLMANRMAVSHHKYGILEAKYPDSAHAIDSAMQRIELYKKTGNTEHVIDAANFLMIEHLFPSHKKAHFRATSSQESPGIKYKGE